MYDCGVKFDKSAKILKTDSYNFNEKSDNGNVKKMNKKSGTFTKMQLLAKSFLLVEFLNNNSI